MCASASRSPNKTEKGKGQEETIVRRAPKKLPLKTSGRAVAVEHFFPETELRRIAERILKLSDADETEVAIDAAADALTRFANNTIHQNVAERILTVSVRTVFDGRTARASTNKTDDESLRRVVAAAARLARSQPTNHDLLPMPGPQKYAKVDRFFPATAGASPDDRARVVKRVVDLTAGRNQTAAGIFATGAMRSALANSRGLWACYQQTRSEFSITVMGADSSGWAKANSPDVRQIDAEALVASASRKAELSRHPREVPPGRYTVILEPAAALDLVGFLFYDFSGTAVLDQRSCLTGRLGKPLFGENITLWDDVTHPLQLGPPFDGEGMPRQKVLLVDRGTPANLVYARATARKMNVQPTGHGFALPNEFGEAPMNLVWSGGTVSPDQMLASTERGILVTRLWYIREVDPYEKILTGMTRDGTFLVEDGRIVSGIRNLRFNQSLIEMLSSVEALGPAVRAAGEESFEMVVPAMKVRNFHFTEVTKF
jgi:predicted Zn-dependent protease